MKTIKIIIISLLVGLNLTSCDFLEKDPTYTTPENFFKNEADATSWLTGTYAILGQSSFYGNEFLYLVGGDDLGHYGGANRGPNKSGLICNNANTSDPAVAALWYTLYSGINRANIFLENIDAVPDMNDDTRKQYKAEARFLRAFYYFTLVECWGDVPFKTTSTEDAYNLSIPRTDKQTIYDFIIKEMYGSAEDLKSAQDLNYLPGRVSKSAAWGMLMEERNFRVILHEVNFSDTLRYKKMTGGNYLVLQEHYLENHHIRKGNIIRLENSTFSEIMRVKRLIASKMASESGNTVLYHLDSLNLSMFEEKEINQIYTPIP